MRWQKQSKMLLQLLRRNRHRQEVRQIRIRRQIQRQIQRQIRKQIVQAFRRLAIMKMQD